MFHFTPLLGAQSESPASQSLLELDGGVTILVDVGWDEAFDVQRLEAVERQVSTLSIILLTHATIEHLGAYAHCCKHIPLFTNIPVYATTPVVNLGRTLLTDLYASTPHAASIIPLSSVSGSPASDASPNLLFEAPTPDDIASYFARINPLKYSQPHQPIASPFSPSLGNLTITAYGAGHTLGGTLWHIQHGMESIVYAADWNQGRENLLPGATLLSGGQEIIEPLQRPTALICSSGGAERGESLPRKDRDATLSMLEWVEESVRAEAEAAMTKGKGQGDINNPMDWRFIKMLERESGVQQALTRSKPCVLLASDASLEWGFAKQAVQALASDPRNLVILTEKVAAVDPLRKGLGKQLWEAWQTQTRNSSGASGAKIVSADGMTVDFRQASTAALNLDETAFYETYAARQRQLHSTLQGDNTLVDPTATDVLDPQDEDESSDSDGEDEDVEHQGRALNLSAQLTQQSQKRNKSGAGALSDAELGVNVLLKGKTTVHDYDVRGKRGREKLFPFVAQRQRGDEFGDAIKPEEYLRAEERDAIEGVDMRDGSAKQNSETAAVGQKRKWGETAGPKGRKGEMQAPGNKRARMEGGKPRAPDDIDAAIARATGERGKRGGAPPTTEEGESDEDEESDYEPDDAVPSGPQKLVYESRTLDLRLRIAHVDFSALHDLRALLMIVPLIRPRKLILISGEESETQRLAAEFRKLRHGSEEEGSGMEISTPRIGEVVDASVDTNAWTLKLSRALVKRLTWQNVKGLGVVALTGSLGMGVVSRQKEDESGTNKRKKLKLSSQGSEDETASKELVKSSSDTNAKEEVAIPILDLPFPSTTNSSASSLAANTISRITQPVHVGDTRLADLRALLRSSGHEALFSGEGTLLIDGSVVVRKSASGKVEIEGVGLARGFDEVRRAVYGGLALVAGV
ncbi:hypothetical protein LTR48_001721 [Friedmanniomyces endolithicus]|uniref:Cleavage and polyadenylation specificity factor subunit 2 n=1 Tax=Rachicladosporium monterosium TaxID=1507873 RepID=A0ABR0LCX1_9PEZI|nr:hypothetical protein LTR48_001721 [Friedmanniomyces endolithicus]KAK5146944.1 hypothetical protein LTR32_001553 [Rachicladosporium monterosium]